MTQNGTEIWTFEDTKNKQYFQTYKKKDFLQSTEALWRHGIVKSTCYNDIFIFIEIQICMG